MSTPTAGDESDGIKKSSESIQPSLDTNNMLYDPQNFDPATQGDFKIMKLFL